MGDGSVQAHCMFSLFWCAFENFCATFFLYFGVPLKTSAQTHAPKQEKTKMKLT